MPGNRAAIAPRYRWLMFRADQEVELRLVATILALNCELNQVLDRSQCESDSGSTITVDGYG